MTKTRREYGDTKFVEVACDIKHATASAVKIYDGNAELWIPRSQLDTPDDEIIVGQHMTLLVAEWFATKNGLI